MSRIGKQPIKLPEGVTAEIKGREVVVKGPKGELSFTLPKGINIEMLEREITLKPDADHAEVRALWGTARTTLANLVHGVEEGFEKRLLIEGVGYRAAVQEGNLVLSIGFSHPVQIKPPPGINFTVQKNVIVISGADKVLVGETAAKVRRVRKPEPYKGKGIRYENELVRRKAGKKAGVAAGAAE